MKWRYFLMILPLMGFTRLHLTYKTNKDVQDELVNMENGLQDKSFTIVRDTPTLSDMRDGEVMILSSGTVNNLIWRSNQEIYSVKGSCVTVYR